VTDGPDTILVLAGSRGGVDSLARQEGVPHKGLIPLAGVPMIERVIGVLRSLGDSAHIVIACDRPDALVALPEICGALSEGRLTLTSTAATPSRTILQAMHEGVITPPFLITTADHPLLTAAMIRWFWQRIPEGTDMAAALALAEVVRSACPETRRTYLPFADGRYSGCNLFAVRTTEAQRALVFWQQVETRRKDPLAMIRLLGPLPLARFLLGRLSLQAAVAKLEQLTGTRLAAVALPFAEAAIDVDKPEDLDLARRILESR
jgi:GTP:adenosylcobinamide-phosphate guanylyltransferase